MFKTYEFIVWFFQLYFLSESKISSSLSHLFYVNSVPFICAQVRTNIFLLNDTMVTIQVGTS